MTRQVFYSFIILVLFSSQVHSQVFRVAGKVTYSGRRLANVAVSLQNTDMSATTNNKGDYRLDGVSPGTYILVVSAMGYDTVSKSISVADRDEQANIEMTGKTSLLNNVTIKAGKENTSGMTRLKEVEGTAIYAGKKNEVIVIKDLVANTAANNARQLYSKISGLNIWENDVAGIQLGIGGRGLNPNRVSNFNTRQNGYDISADALGYPESYYTPPAELVDQIEIVRGAASLQYGTQFGGLVNFKLNKGSDSQKIQIISRETLGSWGFFNTSNSIGGTIKNVNYYVFFQHKSGSGWRPNSQFNVNTAYTALTWKINSKLSITGQYTFMDYLEHQPGGLTDQMFAADPRQSVRERNWFKVNWNLGALILDYNINSRLKFNTRFYGLAASRSALGILTYINRADPGGPRDLWTDKYTNWGNESRLLYTYQLGKNSCHLLGGVRIYEGLTDRRQGEGNSGSTGTKSDFEFSDPSDPDYSRYNFPNFNTSIFAENIFHISERFSVIPGVRYEHIDTRADGTYNVVNKDLAGNIIYSQKVDENRSDVRSFVIAGIGLSYYLNNSIQFYGNISQNYRAINFNDIRVVNPNVQVDPNIEDEKGYSADIGVRGKLADIFNYDVSFFMINYNNRLGTILKTDSTFNIYRYNTNIGQSRNLGVEAFGEMDIWKLIKKDQAKMKISLFANLSFIDARYVKNVITAYKDKKVEMVPGTIVKTGVSFKKNRFGASYLFAYTGQQFTDATNATYTANAINGLIPSFTVMDLSLEYSFKKICSVYASINNLANNKYFTRRADSYPGPGIIPSDGRSFYITVQVKL